MMPFFYLRIFFVCSCQYNITYRKNTAYACSVVVCSCPVQFLLCNFFCAISFVQLFLYNFSCAISLVQFLLCNFSCVLFTVFCVEFIWQIHIPLILNTLSTNPASKHHFAGGDRLSMLCYRSACFFSLFL
jgi:hypothetical protein